MAGEDLKTRFPALFWNTSLVDSPQRKRATAPLRYRVCASSETATIPKSSGSPDEPDSKLTVIELDSGADLEKLNDLVEKAATGDASAVQEMKKVIGEKKLKSSPEVAEALNSLLMDFGQPDNMEIDGLDDLEL